MTIMTDNQKTETEEKEPPKQVPLDKYEKAAVLAMLIRQIRFQNIAAEQEPIKAKAEAILNEAKTSINQNREALRSFGFDLKAGLWDQVKLSIGDDMYNSAFAIAKQIIKEDKEKDPSEADDSKEEASGDSSIDKKAGETKTETLDSEDKSPKIRDLIIEQLKKLPPGTGSTSASLRNFLEENLAVDMHEKTVGMTLYRLSKKRIVRREGRTWFFVSRPEKNTDIADKKRGPQVEETSEPT